MQTFSGEYKYSVKEIVDKMVDLIYKRTYGWFIGGSLIIPMEDDTIIVNFNKTRKGNTPKSIEYLLAKIYTEYKNKHCTFYQHSINIIQDLENKANKFKYLQHLVNKVN